MNELNKDFERLTEELLIKWGKWSKSHGIHIGYPKQTPYRKLIGSGVGSIPLDEKTAMAVDAAVSELKEIDPEAQMLAEYYYIIGASLRDLEPMCGIKFGKARELRKFVLAYCLGKLFEYVNQ